MRRGTGLRLEVTHTAHLPDQSRAVIRRLLDDVFGADMTDADWDHALGGMHALGWEGSRLVAHGCVVQRRLLLDGRALRTGYVEAVAVHPDRHRQGYGNAVMQAIEELIRGAYDLGALGSSTAGEALYASRGWQRWQGPLSVLSPSGPLPTEDDGVYVFPVMVAVDVRRPLACDWREGDVW